MEVKSNVMSVVVDDRVFCGHRRDARFWLETGFVVL